jgi:uncharacterized membrane protein YgcG
MKIQDFQKPLMVIAAVSVLSFLAGNAVAQDSTTSTATPSATVQTAPQLSYGVSQIVQLAQAKVSDGTIIAYIQNSGNSYGLDANQIIYLRQHGISESVINAMLNQHNNSAVAAAPQQSSSDTSAQTSTAVAQPTVTYVQTVPSSSVYVIPDTQTYNYDAWYYSQPYYYPYYAWPYPAVSLSFGFGGRWGGGYYHGGGFHGGGHGGWHH